MFIKLSCTNSEQDTMLKKLSGNREELIVREKKFIHAGFNFYFSTHTIISKKKSNKFIFSNNYGCSALQLPVLQYGPWQILNRKMFYGDAMPE